MCRIWCAFLPSFQFRLMTVQHREKFIVVNITEAPANMNFSQETEVCHQLTEAHIRRHFPYIR